MGGGRVGDTRAYKCHVAAVTFLSGPVVVTLALLFAAVLGKIRAL